MFKGVQEIFLTPNDLNELLLYFTTLFDSYLMISVHWDDNPL